MNGRKRAKDAHEPPDRPAGVPADAAWHDADREWQLGTSVARGKRRKEQVPTGEWRYWTAEGRLCCVAHFDDDGLQHGTVERYHPDGSLASRGDWKHGSRGGHFLFQQSDGPTGEGYPADHRTHRYEFDSTANWEEHAERWFLKDGTECTADGRPLHLAYDLDDVIAAADPGGFLESHASAVRESLGQPERPEAGSAIAALWGSAPPEILAFLRDAVEGDGFTPATSHRTFEGNVWRSLVAHPWGNLHEELGAVLAGAVPIGSFGDSDTVYATLFAPSRQRPAPNAVYLWSHETYHVDDVLALSLDDFAFRVAVAAASGAQRLSRPVARDAWRKLRGRTHLGYEATSGIEGLTEPGEDEAEVEAVPRADFEANLDPENVVRGPFWRGQWILQLLVPDDDRQWSDVRECFRPGWNKPLDDAAFQDLLVRGSSLPHLGVYLCWRSFWFDQAERLAACREAYRSHPAPVLRDLVLLLDEIAAGEVSLGGIADILDVREGFRKLDLCPEQTGARAAAAASAAAADEERASEVRAVAARAAATGLNGVLDIAWCHAGDPVALREIEAVARTIPGQELQWRALDWVRARGYERGEREHREEAVDLGAWLGRAGCRGIQPFVWGRLDEHPQCAALLLPAIARTPGSLDPRLVPALLARLDVVEEYHHKRALAVSLLGAMAAREAIPRLRALIGEYLNGPGSKAGFDASLATIPWSDMLASIADALRLMAEPTAAEAGAIRAELLELATRLMALGEHDLSGKLVRALVAWGETGLAKLARGLLASGRDTSQLLGLRTAEALAHDAAFRKAFTGWGLSNPDESDNAVTLLYHRVAAAFAAAEPELVEGALPITEAMELARELSTYGTERWIEWRIVECETVGRFPELDLGGIAPHLRSGVTRVRDAAREAHARRGIAPPATRSLSWPDVWQLVASSATTEDATRGIAAMLAAPDAVGRTPAAAWLWEHSRSAPSASILAAVVDAELDRLQPLGAGEDVDAELYWLVRALARHGDRPEAAAAIERCLAIEGADTAIIQELDRLPSRLAPRLLEIAAEDQGWRRSTIARWLLARDDEQVAAALASAKVGRHKLQSWAS